MPLTVRPAQPRDRDTLAAFNAAIARETEHLDYNPPYGDIYMKIAEPFRRKGLGAYLVQELKAVCRAADRAPAARCNVANVPSRKTLQRSGFIPCGNILVGDLKK